MLDYSEIVAENLIKLRKSQELTQQDFAKIFNYSDKTISKWELGYTIPSVETLKQIADYYGVTIDYFLVPHDEISAKHMRFISRNTKRIMITALFNLFFISIIATVFAAIASSLEGMTFWPIFIWGVFICSLFNFFATNAWWKLSFAPYIFITIAIWSSLFGVYFTLIWSDFHYNFWYLFFIGLPVQLASIILLTLSHSSTRD